ncbi:MAG: type II secretion system major pseudopilin GspG [Phycisphaerae bacterium]|nr:type II secretion system major pseudopilin GspG [Phycisphaerae bacterium]
MNRRKNLRYGGFTMVELMAILVILGLLAAVVATNVISKIDKAKVTTTKTSLKSLHNAVIQFKLDTGEFPSEDIGLDELVEEPADLAGWQPGGYLESTEVSKDSWGNEFIYERYPASGKPFVIISYGADGEEGGEENDKDLHSTDPD